MRRYVIAADKINLVADCILMCKEQAIYNRFILGKTREQDHERILECIDFYISKLLKYQRNNIDEYISYVYSLKQTMIDKWNIEKYGIEKEEI